jgi:hypothetical protein
MYRNDDDSTGSILEYTGTVSSTASWCSSQHESTISRREDVLEDECQVVHSNSKFGGCGGKEASIVRGEDDDIVDKDLLEADDL